jgi:hypothetical protein
MPPASNSKVIEPPSVALTSTGRLSKLWRLSKSQACVRVNPLLSKLYSSKEMRERSKNYPSVKFASPKSTEVVSLYFSNLHRPIRLCHKPTAVKYRCYQSFGTFTLAVESHQIDQEHYTSTSQYLQSLGET